jgi:hypothetical protein
MKLVGAAHCWIVRLFGGKHLWSKPKRGEQTSSLLTFDWYKICRRCELVRDVKRRVKGKQE